jgi:hypothetical protein
VRLVFYPWQVTGRSPLQRYTVVGTLMAGHGLCFTGRFPHVSPLMPSGVSFGRYFVVIVAIMRLMVDWLTVKCSAISIWDISWCVLMKETIIFFNSLDCFLDHFIMHIISIR